MEQADQSSPGSSKKSERVLSTDDQKTGDLRRPELIYDPPTSSELPIPQEDLWEKIRVLFRF